MKPTKLLASVRSADEARTALAAPVDLIDLKEPGRGALGALDIEVVHEIVALCAGQRPLSATVGNLPPDPQAAAAGVNYVKIGFFDAAYLETCAGALAPLARRYRLIGVLFADRLQHFDGPARLLKYAGFTGVMIDTADKSRGSVRTYAEDEALRRFVAAAHELSLLCGIAGSLTLNDIATVAAFGADYLGFRTALCESGKRDGKICTKAIAEAARKMGKLPVKAA